MTTEKDFGQLRQNATESPFTEPLASANICCDRVNQESEQSQELVSKRPAPGETDSSERSRKVVKTEPLSEDEELHPAAGNGADRVEPSSSNPTGKHEKKGQPSEADQLFCDDCGINYPGDCPVHGPLTHIKDTHVPLGDPQRASKTLPEGLSIRRTTLKDTKYSVFTTKSLPSRIFFGPYEGVLLGALKSPTTRFSRQVHTATGNAVVEGRPIALSNWMRYVNTASRGQQHNLVPFERAGALYYKTCRVVGAFEELLLLNESADLRISSTSGSPRRESLLRSEVVYSCGKCGDCFSSRASLTRHDRYHHADRPLGLYTCSQCDYSTNRRPNLDQHVMTHTGERPYVCEICQKDFTWRSDLNVHLLTHTKERPYECPDCGERFNCPSHLLRHRKMHSSDSRPHACPHCGKCYARKDYLKVHVRTHMKDKQHECQECGRKFVDPSNARHHYQFVHAKQYPFSCPHCSKGFASRRDVRRHVLARHDGEEE